ncbi:hypothetical protein HGRIS_014835 [Hohenbuehelia grisea]|uniref:Uncharacterized protein n=1 Tax=Hohenbuehelia grisea TaxID=104357 RepID=A0ABR3IQW2_9AGAR
MLPLVDYLGGAESAPVPPSPPNTDWPTGKDDVNILSIEATDVGEPIHNSLSHVEHPSPELGSMIRESSPHLLTRRVGRTTSFIWGWFSVTGSAAIETPPSFEPTSPIEAGDLFVYAHVSPQRPQSEPTTFLYWIWCLSSRWEGIMPGDDWPSDKAGPRGTGRRLELKKDVPEWNLIDSIARRNRARAAKKKAVLPPVLLPH